MAKLSLGDYDLDQRLIDRLRNHHRGVFICGRPGSGKTTLAQAIAEYLDTDVGAMVKTMEAPRTCNPPTASRKMRRWRAIWKRRQTILHPIS